MKERVIGALLLVGGAGLAYLCVYQPLESARNAAPNVSVTLKGAIITPMLVVAGLLYLSLGARATAVMGTREKPTPAAYAIMLGAAALGFGLYFWLRSALEAHGYDFKGRF